MFSVYRLNIYQSQSERYIYHHKTQKRVMLTHLMTLLMMFPIIIISQYSTGDGILLIGDFNARTGCMNDTYENDI